MKFLLDVSIIEPRHKTLQQYIQNHGDTEARLIGSFVGAPRTIGTNIIRQLSVGPQFVSNSVVDSKFNVEIDYGMATVVKEFDVNNIFCLSIDIALVEKMLKYDNDSKEIGYDKEKIINLWKTYGYSSLILSEGTNLLLGQIKNWKDEQIKKENTDVKLSFLQKLLVLLKIKKGQ